MNYDAIVGELTRKGVPIDKAESTALAQLSPEERMAVHSLRATADTRSEKAVEHAGDVLMQKCGFEVIKFSHPGKTRQTPGIADRRYYRRGRTTPRDGATWYELPMAVWWEAKATTKQRPGQKLFQELVTACGEDYVLGGIDDLRAWLKARGIGEPT